MDEKSAGLKQHFWMVSASHPPSISKIHEVNAMKAKWAASVYAVVLLLALGAVAQENGNSNDPVLKTRPNDRNTPSQQGPGNPSPGYGTSPIVAPNAIPDGSRFIVKLKDTP